MTTDFRNFSSYPLGLRNNNPGNLRTGDNWLGMIGENKGFVVFKDIKYGIRAMAIDLIGDIWVDGNNTIRKLITEYAPPSENNTTAYINNVVKYTGIGADQELTNTKETVSKLIRAIMNVELGPSYSALISDQTINDGLFLLPPKWLSKLQAFFENGLN